MKNKKGKEFSTIENMFIFSKIMFYCIIRLLFVGVIFTTFTTDWEDVSDDFKSIKTILPQTI